MQNKCSLLFQSGSGSRSWQTDGGKLACKSGSHMHPSLQRCCNQPCSLRRRFRYFDQILRALGDLAEFSRRKMSVLRAHHPLNLDHECLGSRATRLSLLTSALSLIEISMSLWKFLLINLPFSCTFCFFSQFLCVIQNTSFSSRVHELSPKHCSDIQHPL